MAGFRVAVLVGIVLTVATLVAASDAGAHPACADGTVLELELGFSQDRAVDIIGACDIAGLEEIRAALRADTRAFAPLYTVSVAFWCLLGARSLAWSTERRRRIVQAGAPAIVVAGLLDLVENNRLREVVDAGGASDAIVAASVSSVGKWLLVLYAVPLGVICLVRGIRAAIRGEATLASR